MLCLPCVISYHPWFSLSDLSQLLFGGVSVGVRGGAGGRWVLGGAYFGEFVERGIIFMAHKNLSSTRLEPVHSKLTKKSQNRFSMRP